MLLDDDGGKIGLKKFSGAVVRSIVDDDDFAGVVDARKAAIEQFASVARRNHDGDSFGLGRWRRC